MSPQHTQANERARFSTDTPFATWLALQGYTTVPVIARRIEVSEVILRLAMSGRRVPSVNTALVLYRRLRCPTHEFWPEHDFRDVNKYPDEGAGPGQAAAG